MRNPITKFTLQTSDFLIIFSHRVWLDCFFRPLWIALTTARIVMPEMYVRQETAFHDPWHSQPFSATHLRGEGQRSSARGEKGMDEWEQINRGNRCTSIAVILQLGTECCHERPGTGNWCTELVPFRFWSISAPWHSVGSLWQSVEY